jgi:hypothetical protein
MGRRLVVLEADACSPLRQDGVGDGAAARGDQDEDQDANDDEGFQGAVYDVSKALHGLGVSDKLDPGATGRQH